MNNPARASRADGADTRARILETAGELFAAQGFAQTPNKTIAAAAQVDLASINYHFGNREGLYQAVLVEAHRRTISLADLQQLADSPLSAEAKLRLLLDGVMRKILAEQGWHTRVMAQAFAQPVQSHQLLEGEILPKSVLTKQIASDISGIPAAEPALQLCMINILAPVLMLFLFGHHLPAPLQGIDTRNPDALAEHFHRYAVAGLQAAGDAWRAKRE
ncbi:MAG: TetR/AcrR family transcriptional regulator [Neisseria sp.]|nr:TetR/AcrR family transcriptional regulator [Neisseria sp.]